MHIEFLHFDTLLGKYNNNSVYDCSFVLSNPIRNIQNIYLKSLEIPISFNNIRASNSTNTFQITVLTSTYTITIDENNYTSITTLLNDINTKLHLVLPNITFGLNMKNKVIITLTGYPSNTTIQFNKSRLLNIILGFTSLSYINNITAENNYLLAYDNYISMFIQDIPVKSSSFTTQLISFKIPLNAVNGVVYYLQELNSFSQSVEFTYKNYVLSNLIIVIFDRFGIQLTNGLDYSFSLAVSYYDQ